MRDITKQIERRGLLIA